MHSRQLVGIDALRFVAAAMVVVYHLAYSAWVRLPDSPRFAHAGVGDYAYSSLSPMIWFGWVGVEIFFVISGFVISFSAEKATAANFLRSRILRLVPAAWICASISGIILISSGVQSTQVFTLLVRTAGFWPFQPWLSGVYWTLAVEIAFYVMVLTLLAFGLRAYLVAALVGIGVISTAFWLFCAVDVIIPGRTIPMRIEQLLLLRHGCFFAVGGLIYFATCRRRLSLCLLAISITSVGCISEIAFQNGQLAPISLTYGLVHTSVVPVTAWFTAIALMVALVLYNERLSRYVSAKFTREVGVATYPLYLLHSDVGAATMRVAARLGANASLALIAALTMSTAVSLAVARLAEPQLRRATAFAFDVAGRTIRQRDLISDARQE